VIFSGNPQPIFGLMFLSKKSTARLITGMLALSLTACAMQKQFSATGTVTGITRGKDGYMANLTNAQGKEYTAVISRIHLQKAYTDLKEGDQVKVWGDTTLLDNKISIRVKKLTRK